MIGITISEKTGKAFKAKTSGENRLCLLNIWKNRLQAKTI